MRQKSEFNLIKVNSSIKLGLFLFLLICFSFIFFQPVNAQETGMITGLVFEDLNFNNNIDPAESKLTDWRINLYQDGELIKNQLTNSLGKYSFTNLAPGDYHLELEIPNQWAEVSAKDVYLSLKSSEEAEVNFGNYQIVRGENGIGPTLILISNAKIQVLSPTSMKITWFTNHPATSQVIFGPVAKADHQLVLNDSNLGYPFSTKIDWQAVTFHSITLTDLKPQTTYYYRVVSLPNPRQWRGATRIFNSEFGFTTGSLLPKKQSVEELEKPLEQEVIEPILLSQSQKILSQEFKETKKLTIAEPTSTSTEELEVQSESTSSEPLIEAKEEKEDEEDKVTTNCQGYIWFLLILNALILIFVRLRGRRSKSNFQQQFWLLVLILIIVPVIIWYPQCELIIWLIITLILMIIYLSLFKKKSEPSESAESSYLSSNSSSPPPKPDPREPSPEPPPPAPPTDLSSSPSQLLQPPESSSSSPSPPSDNNKLPLP